MKTLKKIFAFVALVTLSAFTGGGHGYHVGDVATDFKLENIDGKWYR